MSSDDEDDAPLFTVVLDPSVSESDLLLQEAELEAIEIRRRAEAEAARIRSDAGEQVRDRLERAAAIAREVVIEASASASAMTEETERLHAEAQRLAEESARHQDAAAETAVCVTERAERAAEQRREQAEEHALTIVQAAWDVSASLQEELLEEAVAEVDAMLALAEADACRLRANAERILCESRDARRHAEAIRNQARRYADDLAIAALSTIPDPSPTEPASAPAARQVKRRWLPLLLVFAGVLAATVVLRTYVIEPQTIAGVSMEPTLTDGQRVVVNKFVYELHPPRRGDVVVFGGDDKWGERLVKRVVGLPGERVEVRGSEVLADGRVVEFSGPSTGPPDRESDVPLALYQVRDGEVLVLGDNRTESRDSRAFGAVPIGDIIGRVDIVFWPPTDLGLI